MQLAGRWTGKASRDGSFSMPADLQRQDRRKIVQHAVRCTKTDRRWIMQHAGRWTGAGQQMDHTACRQMDRDREIVQAVGGQIDN
jgi:hypothetical protein